MTTTLHESLKMLSIPVQIISKKIIMMMVMMMTISRVNMSLRSSVFSIFSSSRPARQSSSQTSLSMIETFRNPNENNLHPIIKLQLWPLTAGITQTTTVRLSRFESLSNSCKDLVKRVQNSHESKQLIPIYCLDTLFCLVKGNRIRKTKLKAHYPSDISSPAVIKRQKAKVS